jgi:hypothetical protein
MEGTEEAESGTDDRAKTHTASGNGDERGDVYSVVGVVPRADRGKEGPATP